jgi:hypothetical protein
MTALTRDRATSYREGVEVEFPVAAGVKIYAGSLVCVNASGYAAPAANAAGYHFVGVAQEQMDNGGGADGAQTVRLRRVGVFEFDADSVTQAMLGTAMYVVDDHTMDDAPGANSVKVGELVKYISTTRGWIDIAR